MLLSDWSRSWMRHVSSFQCDHRPRRTQRPRCEQLEARCQPAAFSFTTGNPDGQMATASRPVSGAAFEIESADDFVLSTETSIDHATFTGLIPTGATVSQVVVEIYRVFPKDSNIARTSGAPTFSTPQVPTRVNSPSDFVFNTRDSTDATQLTFMTADLNPSFSAAKSVQPSGIHPIPGQTTGGDGPVTGHETQFNVTFATPFDLPADHYFFVPQVLLSTGNFLWLSAPKPIVSPGTPFSPDLQSWTRDDIAPNNLAPDWLRIGTDIVGGTPAPTFNASFSLSGQTFTPQITSLSQTAAAEGSGDLTLTVNGSNFTSGSTVLFNGLPLATTFVSSSQLQATVLASLLADEGTANVSVFDAQRGFSNAQTFSILETVPAVSATATVSHASRRVTLNGMFNDTALEGHKVRINWGDGIVDVLDQGVSRSGPFTRSHRFRGFFPRRRTIKVNVLDDEGTTSTTLTFFVRA
jgi:hypothetical protein